MLRNTDLTLINEKRKSYNITFHNLLLRFHPLLLYNAASSAFLDYYPEKTIHCSKSWHFLIT